MKKNLFHYFMVICFSLLLGACTQSSNTPTPLTIAAPTNIPTPTQAAAPQETFTPIPTLQPAVISQNPTNQPGPKTSTLAVITSQAAPTSIPSSAQPSATPAVVVSTSCTDTAGFFGDVTIPDGTSFGQNVSFVKTWSIRNEGTCSWGPDYSLIFYGGDQMSGPLSVPLSAVAPGEISNISVKLKSPSAGGEFTGLWELQNPAGKRFGVNSGGIDQIWVKIGVMIFNGSGEMVSVGATPLPTAAAENNTNPNSSADEISNTTSDTSANSSNKETQNPSATPSHDATPAPSNSCTPQENSDYEQQILGLINNVRAQNNLSPLTLNNRLSIAAYIHSTDMACKNYVDHTGSDGSTWFTRIQAEKFKYSYASENIYVGNPSFGGTPEGAFTWWMNSQVHRDNILSIKVSEIGIGYTFFPNSTYGGYYTLDFAKP